MNQDDENKTASKIFNAVIGVMIVVLVLFLLSKPAQATEHCQEWATQAEHIMIVRQDNISLETITQRLKDTTDVPEESKPLMQNIINAAYKIPVQEKLYDKIVMVNDFADHVLLMCIQQTTKAKV